MDLQTEKGSVYTDSAKAIRSELNLFQLPPTDVSTQSSTEYVQCFPLTSLKEDYNPLEFSWILDTYGSLNESLLNLGVKIVKKEGTACEAADLACLSNLFFHALFSNVQLYLNSELVFDTSGTYAYGAYLQRLLGSSSLEKQGVLQNEFWFPNVEPNQFTTDDGYKIRYDKTKLSTQFYMLGHILTNFSNQTRYLPPGTEVRLVLRRNVPEFYLDNSVEKKEGFSGCPYKALKTDAVFYGAKKVVSAEIVDWHRSELVAGNTLKYPTNEVVVRTFQTPKGLTSACSESLLMGQMPKLLIVGLVDSLAFNGKLTKSGFNFENFNMSELIVRWNGETVQSRVFPFSFKGSDTAGVDNYVFGVESLLKASANNALESGINLINYDKGKNKSIKANAYY